MLNMRDMEIKGFINVAEAAEKIGFTEHWIRKMCERGQIKGAIDISEGKYHNWRIPKDFKEKYQKRILKKVKSSQSAK